MHPKKIESQARACANATAEILWESLVCGRPADRCLAAFLRANRYFGSRDRRLLSETVFACLRWWGWIQHTAPRPFAQGMRKHGPRAEEAPKISPEAWAVFLAAAHCLQGSPFPPAVRHWFKQAGVRGNLRLQTEEDEDLGTKARRLKEVFTDQFTRRLRPVDLLPEWARRRIDSPRPLPELLEWIQSRPPIWLRVQSADTRNVIKELRAEGLDPKIHDVIRNAVSLVEARVNLRTLDAFRRGRIEVQDLASQTVGLICAPKPGERWWDACAGAGGKTLHLAELMQRKGSVTASDVRTYKLKDLRLRARRAAFPNIRTREWKGKPIPRKKGGFDGVLVDVPCSCSGTWRRNPDARWTSSEKDLAEFADLQEQLLTNAADAVNPGGTLVYATCSFFKSENEQVIQAFLDKHPSFKTDPFVHPLTGKSTDGMLQIWPWEGNCDAMFIARMKKT